jgi:N-acetylmuramoyl-L-alanine amidase
VLTFGRTAKLVKPFLLEPKDGVAHYRLVIDLATADKAGFLSSLPAPPPQTYARDQLDDVLEAVTAPTDVSVANAEWPVIVIDAGHGGTDPGAHGPGGVLEKTVTLAAAKQLAQLLEARGRYRIVMTRAGDSRLSLEDRSKSARDAKAELFISLHADANADTKLRGGSVYTLSEEGGERSAREVRAQGDYHVYDLNIGEEIKHDPTVGNILLDIGQTYTKNESSKFAEKLLTSLKGVTPLINNSHRTADLFVLLSPDVPAVLFELAFISNKNDEANLNSPAWREKTMTAVAEAIDAYFDARSLTRQAANAQKPSP